MTRRCDVCGSTWQDRPAQTWRWQVCSWSCARRLLARLDRRQQVAAVAFLAEAFGLSEDEAGSLRATGDD